MEDETKPPLNKNLFRLITKPLFEFEVIAFGKVWIFPFTTSNHFELEKMIKAQDDTDPYAIARHALILTARKSLESSALEDEGNSLSVAEIEELSQEDLDRFAREYLTAKAASISEADGQDESVEHLRSLAEQGAEGLKTYLRENWEFLTSLTKRCKFDNSATSNLVQTLLANMKFNAESWSSALKGKHADLGLRIKNDAAIQAEIANRAFSSIQEARPQHISPTEPAPLGAENLSDSISPVAEQLRPAFEEISRQQGATVNALEAILSSSVQSTEIQQRNFTASFSQGERNLGFAKWNTFASISAAFLAAFALAATLFTIYKAYQTPPTISAEQGAKIIEGLNTLNETLNRHADKAGVDREELRKRLQIINSTLEKSTKVDAKP